MKTTNQKVGRWHWLLLIPCLLMLTIPLYNRIEPRLFGFPFFYWYQFFGVLFGAATMALVYLKVFSKEREDEQ